jgi:glycosyltransferase involved in cell wall biosynthesis
MKIVFVATAQVPSDRANSIQVMKVCQAFAQLGHQVTLLLPNTHPGRDKRDWESLSVQYGLATRFQIEWLSIPFLAGRRGYIHRAVRRARQLQADILYTRVIPAAVWGLLHRLPVILEMHELPGGFFGPVWYRLFLRLPGRKRMLPLTHSLRRMLEKAYPSRLSDEQVLVSPSGVDIERFENLSDPESARRQLGLPPGPTVVCTGHLYPGRGMDLFLKLASRLPVANFLWVGGRENDVQIWQQQAQLGNLNNVTFSGFIPNQRIPLYQAAADVLVMPYQSSVSGSGGGDIAGVFSPLKMFEYMATGRAILCSDLPALREILSDDMACFAPIGDVDAWQVSLERLLSDHDFSNPLAQAARIEARHYSWLERARRALKDFA